MSDWTWTQAGRVGQISTILGTDKILLESFSATERFNEPFSIEVDVITEDKDVDFTPCLGSGVSISIDGDATVARHFHGVLFEAARKSVDGGVAGRFRLSLRPWMSLLDLGRNSRIYQNMSVKDIIDDVIKRAGFTDYSINLSNRGLTQRNYCVQFRESDFMFISRLMEDEGLYYYFVHSAASHKLMICDKPSAQPKFPSTANVFHDSQAGFTDRHLWTWGGRVRPALDKVSLRDTNFQKATEILSAEKDAPPDAGPDKAEFFDYPAGFGYYADDGSQDGSSYAATPLLASRGVRNIRHGEGDMFAIPIGDQLTVMDAEQSQDVLIVATTHIFGLQDYLASESETLNMQVQFEAVLSGVDWRPLRKTPKPVAGGPQTATVVGAAGEVIEVDKFGRIHVQFPWDRVGTMDSKSSCWIRVSQGMADGGFGHVNIPRVGEEVIVDFLDGDPDRPIVTGRVYNSARMPPYALPDEKTKSTWKSQTVGASGAYDGAENPPTGTGFNEIRYEDKGGSEELFVHAQRIFNAWYRLDETRKTGRDTAVRVGRNRQVNVQKNETVVIETGDETRTIQQGSRQTTIQKADALTLNSGDYSLTVSQGQATIQAMQQITLKVGSNQIVISQQGIQITGLTVKATATTSLSVEGLTTDLKADTMMTIGGVMVQIN